MCERVFTQSRTRSFFFPCSFTSSLFILLVSLRLQPMSELLVAGYHGDAKRQCCCLSVSPVGMATQSGTNRYLCFCRERGFGALAFGYDRKWKVTHREARTK